MKNRKVKLGIIPTGTANVLAKELKIPFDIMNACEIITQENELRLDLGKNDRGYFILVAGVGIDAMVVKDLSALMRILPESKGVIYTKGKIVSVASDTQVPYQMDGDFAGYIPTKFEIVPNAVSVLVPQKNK